jgi:serine phosphatase RsbU (regulator of sigma subunit)
VTLAEGDLLLLYTDGVLEARRDSDFFGEERLVRLLRRKRVSPERLPNDSGPSVGLQRGSPHR